jgi:chromosome segregation ATPase
VRRVSSEPNLTVRLLRELRADLAEVRSDVAEVKQRLGGIEKRVDEIADAVGGMAVHLFAVTHRQTDQERRLRKLEARPAK